MNVVKCKPWAVDGSQGDFVLVNSEDFDPSFMEPLEGQELPDNVKAKLVAVVKTETETETETETGNADPITPPEAAAPAPTWGATATKPAAAPSTPAAAPKAPKAAK